MTTLNFPEEETLTSSDLINITLYFLGLQEGSIDAEAKMQALLSARVELSGSIEGGNSACDNRLRWCISTTLMHCSLCKALPLPLSPASCLSSDQSLNEF
jgi:hypothetical protein